MWRSVPDDVSAGLQPLSGSASFSQALSEGPHPPASSTAFAAKLLDMGFGEGSRFRLQLSKSGAREQHPSGEQRCSPGSATFSHAKQRTTASSPPHLLPPRLSRKVRSKLSWVITWESLRGEHLPTKNQLVNLGGGGVRGVQQALQIFKAASNYKTPVKQRLTVHVSHRPPFHGTPEERGGGSVGAGRCCAWSCPCPAAAPGFPPLQGSRRNRSSKDFSQLINGCTGIKQLRIWTGFNSLCSTPLSLKGESNRCNFYSRRPVPLTSGNQLLQRRLVKPSLSSGDTRDGNGFFFKEY